MFAIYNDGSLTSRGTFETLYNLKKTHQINPTKNENEEKEFQALPKQDKITREASEVYKKSANLDTRDTVYHVNQIMNEYVLHVTEDTTVNESYKILRDNNIRQVPIINKMGKIQGMVTQKDILDLLMSDLDDTSSSLKKSLSQIQLPQTITADPISDVRRVAKVMYDFNLNAIPIVNEENFLVGIVSRSDILKTVASIPPLQLWA